MAWSQTGVGAKCQKPSQLMRRHRSRWWCRPRNRHSSRPSHSCPLATSSGRPRGRREAASGLGASARNSGSACWANPSALMTGEADAVSYITEHSFQDAFVKQVLKEVSLIFPLAARKAFSWSQYRKGRHYHTRSVLLRPFGQNFVYVRDTSYKDDRLCL